jgi:hypothetical protein
MKKLLLSFVLLSYLSISQAEDTYYCEENPMNFLKLKIGQLNDSSTPTYFSVEHGNADPVNPWRAHKDIKVNADQIKSTDFTIKAFDSKNAIDFMFNKYSKKLMIQHSHNSKREYNKQKDNRDGRFGISLNPTDVYYCTLLK